MRSLLLVVVTMVVLVSAGSVCLAASATYVIRATGDQTFPSAGDPDGLAVGTITMDDATGLISWHFTYENIAAPNALHIHGPNGSAGMGAGIHVFLNVATTGGPGTLINSVVVGNLQDVTDMLNDPSDFYVNIHNADFPGGALRDQLGGTGETYVVLMDGDQEFPGPGDSDGSATGTLTLDVTGLVAWNLTYQSIAAPSAMHIHGPSGSAGMSAGVHVPLNVATTGGPGTLISSLTAAVPDVIDMLNDPSDFYLNIHNPEFQAGAVRGQLGGFGGFSGAVPDGQSVPGSQLLIGKGSLGAIDLDWDVSCVSSDDDYEVYEGTVGNYYSHGRILCSTGGSTSTTVMPGGGSHYYLVVPTDGNVEGSYGTDSDGVERPIGSPVCHDQLTLDPVCP